jgi:maltose alpha-D-glucosyltransferase/alpha-amylase
MQWTGDRNAGFSRADPARLFAPLIMDPVYGYQAINVEAQERSAYSLLNWMRRMAALRRQHRVFGRGTLEFLRPSNRKILAYVRRYEDDIVLCVANLARSIQPVELDLSEFKGYTPVEMLGQTDFPRITDAPYVLTLGVYGFYWFKLQLNPTPIVSRLASQEPEVREEAPALFMGAAWDTLLEGNVRGLIERDLLPDYVRRQRWFGGKARQLARVRFADWGLVRRAPAPVFATVLQAEYADGGQEHYFLPLAMSGGTDAQAVERQHPNAVLARITGARKGIVYDAAMDARAGSALFDVISDGESLSLRNGTLRGWATPTLEILRGSQPLEAAPASTEQSNSMISFGDRLLLKLFRKFEAGPNPDVEITSHLALNAGFARSPRLGGAIDYQRNGAPAAPVAMLQARITSQADGWHHAIDELRRYYERAAVCGSPAPETIAAIALPWIPLTRTPIPREPLDMIASYLESASTLGRRTAEMHLALAAGDDAAFAPEPLMPDERRAIARRMAEDAGRALAAIEPQLPRLPEETAAQARELLSVRDRIIRSFDAVAATVTPVSRIRVHGDYHLGQVLWAENDYYIIDFEGEPARPLAERRARQLALKDVAGMLRSFGYAAYAGLVASAAMRPDDFPRLEPWARVWESWTSASFLRTYLDVTAGAPFLPPSPSETGLLLDAFVLDKALYELRYELNSRPDWVRIPLWSILRYLRGTE